MVERVNLLYEQGTDTIRIDQCVRRWLSWIRAGSNPSRTLFQLVSSVSNYHN